MLLLIVCITGKSGTAYSIIISTGIRKHLLLLSPNQTRACLDNGMYNPGDGLLIEGWSPRGHFGSSASIRINRHNDGKVILVQFANLC